MKAILLAASVLVILCTPAHAQDKPAVENDKAKSAAPPAGAKAKPSAEELEATFKATLTKATLSGRWCSLKDGKLGEEKDDKYTIVSVNKSSGDKWIINTRIKFNQKEMVVPIPVEVKWAGDTAVITVDNLQYPGGGTYSARVLIYNHTYAGTWSGGDHGGLMSGAITNEKE